MHRSGTSLVSRSLERMGLFVGHKKESNHEAEFFLQIDRWLMSQSGAAWDHPAPIRHLLENNEIRPITVRYITEYLVNSPRIVSFLGWNKFVRYRVLSNLPIRWGWKCPLSTYTLPIWLDVFPCAKIIHIYRHGVDVADSLRKRTLRSFDRTLNQELYYQARFLHWIRPKVGGFIASMRCATLEGGFSLWEEYLTEARRHVRALGARAMEVKYEDFLSEPDGTLANLARFCELPLNDEAAKILVTQMKRARAYAYEADPELRLFASRVAQRLELQNYHECRNYPSVVTAERVARSGIIVRSVQD